MNKISDINFDLLKYIEAEVISESFFYMTTKIYEFDGFEFCLGMRESGLSEFIFVKHLFGNYKKIAKVSEFRLLLEKQKWVCKNDFQAAVALILEDTERL